jgi:voltage-gated potassium channel
VGRDQARTAPRLRRRGKRLTVIQALYFSIVTLTTVGYGDFAPTSDGTQIFTIIYILTGLGILVALLASVAEHYVMQKAERGSARERLSARRERRRAN